MTYQEARDAGKFRHTHICSTCRTERECNNGFCLPDMKYLQCAECRGKALIAANQGSFDLLKKYGITVKEVPNEEGEDG